MKAVTKDETPGGVKEGLFNVKMTPAILEDQYLPALEEIAQGSFHNKFSLAVVKNYKLAMRTRRACEKVRMAVVKKYSKLDKDGQVVTEDDKQGRKVAVFRDPSAVEEFNAEITRHRNEMLFDLQVHRVHRSAVESMNEPVRPVTLMMLDPMFYPEEGENEEQEVPEEFRDAVPSSSQTPQDDGTAESEQLLREEPSPTVQA